MAMGDLGGKPSLKISREEAQLESMEVGDSNPASNDHFGSSPDLNCHLQARPLCAEHRPLLPQKWTSRPSRTIFFLRRVEWAGREGGLSSSSCPFARSSHPELGGHLGLWNARGGANPAGVGFGHGCLARPDGPAGVTKLGVVLEIERLAL